MRGLILGYLAIVATSALLILLKGLGVLDHDWSAVLAMFWATLFIAGLIGLAMLGVAGLLLSFDWLDAWRKNRRQNTSMVWHQWVQQNLPRDPPPRRRRRV